jgi:hypothetical protein
MCHGDMKLAEDSAHADAGCYRCHAQSVADHLTLRYDVLARMYPAMLVRSVQATAPVVELPAENCTACHLDDIDSVTAGASGVRINHATCATDATCDGCHATLAHGDAVRWQQSPRMSECVACHRAERASVECRVCHVRKMSVAKLHGAQPASNGKPARPHGRGDMHECSACHSDDECARCHDVAVPHPASFGSTHGESAIEKPLSCRTCHPGTKFCSACHGVKMPHPSGFLGTHPTVAEDLDDPACSRCHEPQDCIRCHERHIHPGGAGTRAIKPVRAVGGDTQ